MTGWNLEFKYKSPRLSIIFSITASGVSIPGAVTMVYAQIEPHISPLMQRSNLDQQLARDFSELYRLACGQKGIQPYPDGYLVIKPVELPEGTLNDIRVDISS